METLCKPLVVSLFRSAPRPEQVLGGLLIQGVKTLTPPFFKINFTIYLFSVVLGLHCCAGFSLFVASGATLESSRGAQASRCSGFCRCRARAPGRGGIRGCGTWARQLGLPGSRAQAQQLCCMGVAAPWHVRLPLYQGLNSRLLPWQAEPYPLSHQESPNCLLKGGLRHHRQGHKCVGGAEGIVVMFTIHLRNELLASGHRVCQPGRSQRQLLIPRGVIRIR